MKYVLCLIVVIAAIGILAGCGGSKTHWIASPYDGTVRGVDTKPPDDDVNVGVDTWIEVYWPSYNYPPPPRFKFRLEKEVSTAKFEGVKTTQEDSFPDEGEWWFAPEHNLAYDTVYRITVEDDLGNIYRAYFVTESGRAQGDSRVSTKKFRPAGAGDKKPTGQPADEHTIETGRSRTAD